MNAFLFAAILVLPIVVVLAYLAKPSPPKDEKGNYIYPEGFEPIDDESTGLQ